MSFDKVFVNNKQDKITAEMNAFHDSPLGDRKYDFYVYTLENTIVQDELVISLYKENEGQEGVTKLNFTWFDMLLFITEHYDKVTVKYRVIFEFKHPLSSMGNVVLITRFIKNYAALKGWNLALVNVR